MSKNVDALTPHMRKRSRNLTKEEKQEIQDKFLKSFSNTANVRAACMAAGISRTSIYVWLEKDEEFSIRYRQAELDANDLIRGELFRRAVQGVEKPVVSMGRVVYDETPMLGSDGKPILDGKGKPVMKPGKPLMERVYSDNLLSLLAKARMPEFREKQQVELSGPGGGPLQTVEIYKVRIPDNGRNETKDTTE